MDDLSHNQILLFLVIFIDFESSNRFYNVLHWFFTCHIILSRVQRLSFDALDSTQFLRRFADSPLFPSIFLSFFSMDLNIFSFLSKFAFPQLCPFVITQLNLSKLFSNFALKFAFYKNLGDRFSKWPLLCESRNRWCSLSFFLRYSYRILYLL